MSNASDGTVSSRTWINTQFRACVAAFTFLTRIPAYHLVAHDADDLAGSTPYFPFVGLVVGCVGSLIYFVGTTIWSIPIAIVLSVAATVWLTGAFHEDALADTFDGFGGGWDPPQVLAIMKDSRVGSYALVGVVLVIVAKLAALFAVATAGTETVWQVGRVLIAGHVLGRWSSIALIYRYPYVRVHEPQDRVSAGRSFVSGVTRSHFIIATVATVIIVSVVMGWRVLPVALVAIIVTWIAGRYFKRRIGGITGDTLGAANQMVELCVYLVLASRVMVRM